MIHADGKTYDVPPAHERRVTDPTGCGDAFRAGLIFGIEKGYDWLTIGRIGNLMGALKVEHPGTQNQRFDYAEFAEQFKQQFGYALADRASLCEQSSEPRVAAASCQRERISDSRRSRRMATTALTSHAPATAAPAAPAARTRRTACAPRRCASRR